MNARHLEIATLCLSGKKPAEIAAAAGISSEALVVLRKSKAYRKVESDLASKMLEQAGASLQGLAVEAVEKLRSILKIPARNLTGKNGTERKIGDPALLKEQRLTAISILQLGAQIAEKEADSAESQALDARLLTDTDHD